MQQLQKNFKPDSFLKRLVSIPSGTEQKSGVNQVGDVMINELGMKDFVWKTYKCTNSKFGDMHYGAPAKMDKKKKQVLLVGHLDTVFNTITEIKPRVVGRTMYAPGSNDMKGGLTILVGAVKELQKSDWKNENIHILLLPDEEQMNVNNFPQIKEIVKNITHVLVFEGDNNGKAIPEEKSFVVQRRGFMGGKLTCQAAGGHSGLFMKKKDIHSAVHEILYKSQQLLKLTDYAQGTTVNIGMINGGTAVNAFAQNAEITFSIRMKTKDEYERVEQSIAKIVTKASDKTTKSRYDQLYAIFPMQHSQEIELFFTEVQECLPMRKVIREFRGGGSDANRLAFCKPDLAILDNFGSVGGGEHTPEEFIFLDSLERGIEITACVLNKMVR